jgi:ATP-dependent RNA helicase RhlE
MKTFQDFDLLPSLHETLQEKELITPTDIQGRMIPLLLSGKSAVGIAETGSGKTLSFALPILHRLKTLENEGKAVDTESRPRALILVPTRELGEQVAKVFKPFTHTTRLRVRSVLGGTTMEMTRRSVAGKFEVLVATPGRLIQLIEKNLIDLSDVKTLVLDEADQMLDQGFLPNARLIASACPTKRQIALFSATVSAKVQELMKYLFDEVEIIRTEGSSRPIATLNTRNLPVPNGKRFPLLQKLLQAEKVRGGTLIFTNTREQCDKLAAELQTIGLESMVYRGEMDKVQRRKNLKAFRDGQIDFLICTDVASRGLDIDHVARVINYHLPQGMDNYTHRVGRTARAGKSGTVINFVTERDATLMNRVNSQNQNARLGSRKDDARPARPRGSR